MNLSEHASPENNIQAQLEYLSSITCYPELHDDPAQGKWYRISPSGAVSANGKPYHAEVRFGSENKLLFLFHGGGMSWNAEMAARPKTLSDLEDTDAYYFEDMGPIADAVAPGGITDPANSDNPFRDWTILCFPYSTGDLHSGTADFPYTDLNGEPKILHHHGFLNFRSVMQIVLPHLASPGQILISGYSAGGFGAALLTETILSYFPSCRDVTCLVDSSLILYDDWSRAAREVWHAPQNIQKKMKSLSPVLDCFKSIRESRLPVKLLFCCSVRDNELIRISHYAKHGVYGFSEEIVSQFQSELKKLCQWLTDMGADSAYYLFDNPAEQIPDTVREKYRLTRHTIIHSPRVFLLRSDGKTVLEWVSQAMSGHPENIGTNLL